MDTLPGTYALILKAETPQHITVGRLGDLLVRPGFYVYVGSALGPGGVAGRLHHHLAPALKPHWHIDYLRQVAEVTDIWYILDPLRHEHDWAHILTQSAGSTLPMKGFGSSGCACAAHLFYFASPPATGSLLGATLRYAGLPG